MKADARSHELFSRHPDQTLTLPSGKQFAIPYHCYDADSYVLHGTVDLPGAEALQRGENCRPVILRRPGQPDRGVAQIWLNLYRDTNYGPYRELVISFAAGSERESAVFPYRNAASLLLPNLDPRCVVFARWLYLDSQPAIDAGREVFGFPKYRGELSFDPVRSGDEGLPLGARLTHRTLSSDGKEVLRVHLALERTAWNRLETIWLLLRALGVRGVSRIGRAPEAASTLLTPVLLKQVVTPVRAVGRPTLHRWSPECELSFGPETAGGRALTELRFDPVLVHATAGLKFVMLADDPRAMDPIAASDDAADEGAPATRPGE
jgi:hypothetical protein